MAQTSLFVKMVFQPGKRDEGVELLSTMLPQVETEPGTLIYSFHLDAGDEFAEEAEAAFVAGRFRPFYECAFHAVEHLAIAELLT